MEKTEAERMVANQHEGGRESRTRANVRSKSAHPRLINTSNIKEVNLSYKQLQVRLYFCPFFPSFSSDLPVLEFEYDGMTDNLVTIW